MSHACSILKYFTYKKSVIGLSVLFTLKRSRTFRLLLAFLLHIELPGYYDYVLLFKFLFIILSHFNKVILVVVFNNCKIIVKIVYRLSNST